jgi:hypothetical protein
MLGYEVYEYIAIYGASSASWPCVMYEHNVIAGQATPITSNECEMGIDNHKFGCIFVDVGLVLLI